FRKIHTHSDTTGGNRRADCAVLNRGTLDASADRYRRVCHDLPPKFCRIAWTRGGIDADLCTICPRCAQTDQRGKTRRLQYRRLQSAAGKIPHRPPPSPPLPPRQPPTPPPSRPPPAPPPSCHTPRSRHP